MSVSIDVFGLPPLIERNNWNSIYIVYIKYINNKGERKSASWNILYISKETPVSPLVKYEFCPPLYLLTSISLISLNIYFCFIDYAKAFDCVDHNKLWKILKEMGIPDHLTCLLRNLYAGQEATVRTGHGTTDWFQIGKGVSQGCILSPCLFNLYAEYITRNAGWAGRSTNWNQDCWEKYQ